MGTNGQEIGQDHEEYAPHSHSVVIASKFIRVLRMLVLHCLYTDAKQNNREYMEEDGAVTPGSKTFWDVFYDPDSGPLRDKQRLINRRTELNSENTVDSVLDHYEWFTTFDVYEDVFLYALRETFVPSPHCSKVRVLHIGCGNSAFCESFLSVGSAQAGRKSKEWTIPTDILNVDICQSLIERMQCKYPSRSYAICDCCDMSCASSDLPSSRWFTDPSCSPCRIGERSVDIIFDKGTMDALLSAFPGEENPNATRYCSEALRVLRVGGIMVLISINSVEVLLPYFMSPEEANKSFELCFKQEMDVAEQFADAYDPCVAALRIETLGTRYTMYVFRVTCA